MATTRAKATKAAHGARTLDPDARVIDLTVGELKQLVSQAVAQALVQARGPDPRAVIELIRKINERAPTVGANAAAQRQVKILQKQLLDNILPLMEQATGRGKGGQ
jgi:hypothetical protein